MSNRIKIILYLIIIILTFWLKLPYLFYLFLFVFVLILTIDRKSVRVILNSKFLLVAFIFMGIVPVILGEDETTFLGIKYSRTYFDLGTTIICRGAILILMMKVFHRIFSSINIFEKIFKKDSQLLKITKYSNTLLSDVTINIKNTYSLFVKNNSKKAVYIHPIKFITEIIFNLELMAERLIEDKEDNVIK